MPGAPDQQHRDDTTAIAEMEQRHAAVRGLEVATLAIALERLVQHLTKRLAEEKP